MTLKELLGTSYRDGMTVEEADKAFGEAGAKLFDLSKGEYVGKGRYQTLEADVKAKMEENAALVKQLEELRKNSPENVKAEIAKLQEQLKAKDEEYAQKYNAREKEYLIDGILRDAKPRNLGALKGALNGKFDFTKAEVKDGKVAVPALFEPYDKVEIQKSVNGFMRSELYVVAIDNRKVDNENLKTYEKNISLVEATKILDSIFIYNCNLTNKNENLSDQANKLLRNAEITLLGEKERLYIETSNSDKTKTPTWFLLETFPSEDFFFDNTTLREALYRIFEVAHIRPYVNDITYKNGDIDRIQISHKSKIEFEEIKLLADAGDFIGDEAEISIDNYFGTIKARGYNSISKNTIKTGELPFTTSEAQLTTNNMIADLGFPIEDIKSFKIGGSKIRISVEYYHGSVSELTYVDLAYFYDITDKIVDNSIYSLLSKK